MNVSYGQSQDKDIAFKAGQAPWESESPEASQGIAFEAGKAPWEIGGTSEETAPVNKPIAPDSVQNIEANMERLFGKGILTDAGIKASTEDFKSKLRDMSNADYRKAEQLEPETYLDKASSIASDITALHSKFHTTARNISSFFKDSIDDVDEEDTKSLAEDGWTNIQKANGKVWGADYSGSTREVKLSDIVTAEKNKVARAVVNELSAQGFEGIKYQNNKLSTTVNGKEVEVESSILRDLWAHKYEIAAGTAVGLGVLSLPISGPAMVGVGALGTGIASMPAAGLDAIANKIDMINEVDNEVIKDKMVDAGVYNAVFNVIGDALFYGARAGYHYGKYPYKWLDQIYGLVKDGNIDGAHRAVLDHMGVSKSQADEIVRELEALTGKMVGTDEEKAIQALIMTRPGGEAVVNAAIRFDSKAGANMINSVTKRADDLLQATKNLSADNIAVILKQNLDTYIKEVKNLYRVAKEAPLPYTKGYTFDFDAIGLQPLAERIGARIENPTIKQRFQNILTKIADISEDRSFTGLIDLRQAANDLKFSSKLLKVSDREAIDAVIKSIDTEIERAGRELIPKYDEWAKIWSTAKTEYAKMKQLESNVLFKVLSRPGIDEDTVVKQLSKYISAEDNTFYEVMEKVGNSMGKSPVWDRVEGAVLNELVEKFAIGEVGGNRAILFPALSRELKKVSWQSPKAKQMVRTIHRMAEVFKNDVNLARVSGRVNVPSFQSYLTTDPVVRMKYELASSIFNYAKQLAPGAQSDYLALVKNAGSLMENPISKKTVDELMRALPKDKRILREHLDFSKQIDDMQQAYIQRQAAIEQMFGKKAPPRLVWKKPLEPDVNVLDTVDEVLYATEKGTVGKNPTEAIMKDRTDDLITEFIWRATSKEVNPTEIADKAAKYMDNARFEGIINSTRNKLLVDDRKHNAKVVANIIKREAEILRKRVEADFGAKFTSEEAEKLVQYRFKETFKDCY